MKLDERIITQAIIERYYRKLIDHLETEVAIVGGGPSGLVAGYYLAREGKKVSLYERKLSIGGGMWGGGMMFNEIVVQEDALPILNEFGIRAIPYQGNYHTADAVEAVAAITTRAVQAGLAIFNCISVEDVAIRDNRITGLVLNWSPVEIAGLHVDPLTITCRFAVDATGHAAEIVKVVEKKASGRLKTPSGKIEGEKSMWAEKAEALTLENTTEVYPGLYLAGMAANAVFGGPRMGPIFGGMLMSGQKAAELLLEQL